MVSMETQMADLPELDGEEAEGNVGRSLAWIAVAGLGTVFTAGAIVGVIAAATEDGKALSVMAMAIIAALVAIIGALIYTQWNLARRIRTGGGPMTSRERLNRNIMVGCAVLGALIGALLVAVDGVMPSDPITIFKDGPLPLAIAVLLAVFWAVIMPVIAWFWHTRAIDEQEAHAYRDGGYYAAYAYLIGAPTWWFLWRGGLLPEPDGVTIFCGFTIIWTAVWFWKKYR
jgi:magnesium-transporting ATPase (P-type)